MAGLIGYEALANQLAARRQVADPGAFLSALQQEYDLAHSLYADLVRDGPAFRLGRLIHDPNPALERLLRSAGIAPLTPLFEAARHCFGPTEIDLDDLFRAHPGFRKVLADCNLDRPHLLFPLVPSQEGVAFFAFYPRELRREIKPVFSVLRDLSALSGLFHASQLAMTRLRPVPPKPPSPAPRLTPREREVLQWVANGKTYWEIARILGISERTVRHFMANCREKLEAVSNKQAVAKAVAAELVAVRQTSDGHAR